MKDFVENYQNADGGNAILANAEKVLNDAIVARKRAYDVLKDYEKNIYEPKENWYFQVNDGNHPVELKAFLPEWNSIVETRKGYSNTYEAKNKAFIQAKKDYEEAKLVAGVTSPTQTDAKVNEAENATTSSYTPPPSVEEAATGMNPILKWSLIGGGGLALIGLSYLLIKKLTR